MKKSIEVNGISRLCITKLDVLDDLEEIFFCVRYENGENFSSVLVVQIDTNPSMSKLRDGNVQRKMLSAGIHCQKMHSTI